MTGTVGHRLKGGFALNRLPGGHGAHVPAFTGSGRLPSSTVQCNVCVHEGRGSTSHTCHDLSSPDELRPALL
jgi:hypothetical protein